VPESYNKYKVLNAGDSLSYLIVYFFLHISLLFGGAMSDLDLMASATIKKKQNVVDLSILRRNLYW